MMVKVMHSYETIAFRDYGFNPSLPPSSPFRTMCQIKLIMVYCTEKKEDVVARSLVKGAPVSTSCSWTISKCLICTHLRNNTFTNNTFPILLSKMIHMTVKISLHDIGYLHFEISVHLQACL